MLKFDDIKYGIFPYGTLNGMNVFHISFSTDESPYKSPELMQESVNEIFNQIKNSIEKQRLEDPWLDALLGLHYVIFTGKNIMDDLNIVAINYFYMVLSTMSLEVQKEKPQYKLKPVQMCYYGIPEHFTGSKTFYENFNLLHVKCPIYDENNNLVTSLTNPTNDMAMAEMRNHSFSSFFTEANTEEEAQTFFDIYVNRKELLLPKERSFIICDYKNIKKMAKIALKLGIRVYIKMPSSKEILTFN